MQEKVRKWVFSMWWEIWAGHVCKNIKYRILVKEEGDKELESKEELKVTPEADNSKVQLSLTSIMRLTTRRYLKSWEPMVDLVDCGARHNFNSKGLVDKTCLSIIDTCPYYVEKGDWHKIWCRGIYDTVVCGCKMFWLAWLGEIRANLDDITSKFNVGEQTKLLKADPDLIKSTDPYLIKGSLRATIRLKITSRL